MNTLALITGESIRSALLKLCCKTPERTEKDESEWMEPTKTKKSSSGSSKKGRQSSSRSSKTGKSPSGSAMKGGSHWDAVKGKVATEKSTNEVRWSEVLENLHDLDIEDLDEGGGERDEELFAAVNATDFSAHRHTDVAAKDDERDFYSQSLGNQSIASMWSDDSLLAEVRQSIRQDSVSINSSMFSDSDNGSENGDMGQVEDDDGTSSDIETADGAKSVELSIMSGQSHHSKTGTFPQKGESIMEKSIEGTPRNRKLKRIDSSASF
mmetsp:Transcript_6352/g.11610  ORF Transcript_6352/g.11610 Transcript_6352/m.11610 type:complete len:267 (+) Transcript_6352:215-1015(+)|eukprot:CAMPEP_0201618352 /NCGR_PEP_ID=MMETSP0492-20130828/38758_1 /ASSEMBLY_ACC=CAM_ASM_000837 /TAXON_ID=420259 /ORGANISM="Thalassiosira gravida, Strain GMp14c1" /LENGTH=266 /DNA_ID=CAMNT_0048086913 /DNA_START=215 /DNA_END=1015 /DNA_ORIENTATION=-